MYAGIVREQRGDRVPRCLRHRVEVEPVEADEQVVAIGAKHAPCFLVGADFLRDEHQAELADDEIEALIIEW